MPSLSASNVYTHDTISELPLPELVEPGGEDDSASLEVETSELQPEGRGERDASSMFPPLLLVLAPLMLVTAVMVIWLMLKSLL